MTRIHTRTVIDMSSGEVLEDDWYEYDGPIASCDPVTAAIGGGALGLAGSIFGPDEQTTTSQVQIPDFLRPFLEQQAGIGQGALGQLQGLLGGQTVAGFNPDQFSAINLARQRALGAGGFFPTAQQQFLQTAQGQGGLSLGTEGISALRGFAGGQVPGLPIGNQGINALQGIASGQIPGLPPGGPGIEQLQRTASGDFLSAPGFQSAFEGALRQAQPQIAGAFSLAGRTGSGLAQTAQTQAAADAFSGLFNAERQRQVGAGTTLAGLADVGAGRQLQARLGAGGQLAGLADIGLGRQIQTQLGAGSRLAGLGDVERSRQLQAAGFLPQLAGMDVNMLQQIGGLQQQQQQRQLLGPILAQQQLLQASGGPVNLAALLGQQTSQPIHSNPFGAALGGGLMGLTLGGLFPGGSAGSLPSIPSFNFNSPLFGNLG